MSSGGIFWGDHDLLPDSAFMNGVEHADEHADEHAAEQDANQDAEHAADAERDDGAEESKEALPSLNELPLGMVLTRRHSFPPPTNAAYDIAAFQASQQTQRLDKFRGHVEQQRAVLKQIQEDARFTSSVSIQAIVRATAARKEYRKVLKAVTSIARIARGHITRRQVSIPLLLLLFVLFLKPTLLSFLQVAKRFEMVTTASALMASKNIVFKLYLHDDERLHLWCGQHCDGRVRWNDGTVENVGVLDCQRLAARKVYHTVQEANCSLIFAISGWRNGLPLFKTAARHRLAIFVPAMVLENGEVV